MYMYACICCACVHAHIRTCMHACMHACMCVHFLERYKNHIEKPITPESLGQTTFAHWDSRGGSKASRN